MKIKALSFVALLSAGFLVLSGCASTDKVVFVTSTEVGIGYDAKIGNANIGYDRNELVIGPAYPETGATPPVYARLESNLKVLGPKVKQLYATGDAATIVTSTPNQRPVTCQQKDLHGNRRIMVFGTASNIGLKVHFTGNQPVPDSVNFGYKRKELSLIPLRSQQPTAADPDVYASVIAGLNLDAESSGLPDTRMELSQFIATGIAAENVARDKGQIFRSQAQQSLQLAAARGIEQAMRNQTMIDDIIAHVSSSGQLDQSKLSGLIETAGIEESNRSRTFLTDAKDAGDLKSRLGTVQPLIEPLFKALP